MSIGRPACDKRRRIRDRASRFSMAAEFAQSEPVRRSPMAGISRKETSASPLSRPFSGHDRPRSLARSGQARSPNQFACVNRLAAAASPDAPPRQSLVSPLLSKPPDEHRISVACPFAIDVWRRFIAGGRTRLAQAERNLRSAAVGLSAATRQLPAVQGSTPANEMAKSGRYPRIFQSSRNAQRRRNR